jgi:hypothetical protein
MLSEKIDVYLYEKMIDEVIKVIDKSGYVYYGTLRPQLESLR